MKDTTYIAAPAIAKIVCPSCRHLMAIRIPVEYTIVTRDGQQYLTAAIDTDETIDMSELIDHMAFEHGVFD